MTYRPARKSEPDTPVIYVAIGVWILCSLLGVAFWVGVAYVLLHFIAKVW